MDMNWQSDRRREPRFTMKTSVWVEARDGRPMVATTRDVSDHGLGLCVEGPAIQGGELVRVRFQDEELPALVRHSAGGETLDESSVGLELTEGITERQVHALLVHACLP